MSQTYRIGSLNFTGSQAVLSASLDASGSGRFTSGLTVNGSGNVLTIANNSGTTFFRVADTGITETLGASSGNYSFIVNSNATSGGSFGLSVVAGTNTSDAAIRVRNKANTADLLVVRGDGTTFTNNLEASGSGRFTNGLTVTGSFDAQGIFSVNKDSSGSGSIVIPYNSGLDTITFAGFPQNPVTGSMFLDPITNDIYVYTGVVWMVIPLTALPA
jgi:hypothetical protein